MVLGSLFLAIALKGPAFGLSPAQPRVFPPPPAASISVARTLPNATRVRALLTNISPEDAVLWVEGTPQVPIGFDTSLAYNGALWTPSVPGDTITIISAPDVRFSVDYLIDVPPISGAWCLVDVASVADPIVQRVATSVGRYNFISGREAVLCSGALITDARDSFEPYFLTANHCVMTPAEAATVEVFWNDGSRTWGAQLLASALESDAALLRLSSVPGARTFLGWTTARPAEGTLLQRVSNSYSMTRVDERSNTCAFFPRPRFIHSLPVSGSTTAGDSGAPAWIDDGVIVGQLATHCASLPNADPCIEGNKEIDGAFAESYPALKPFLNPPKRRAARH